MNAYCYIIFSKNLGKFYVGACQGNVKDRMQKHNNHAYGLHRFTAKANDWEHFLTILAKNYAHATRIEKHIKSMKSSRYIRNLKKYPELVEKVIQKTSP